MGTYLQVIGGVFIAVFLTQILQKQQKDIGVLLSVGICCMILVSVVEYVKPLINFAERLRQLANLDSEITGILLKAVGIGIIGEIAEVVCTDSGNGTMAKTVQILSGAVILSISLPLMESLLNLLQQILEGI